MSVLALQQPDNLSGCTLPLARGPHDPDKDKWRGPHFSMSSEQPNKTDVLVLLLILCKNGYFIRQIQPNTPSTDGHTPHHETVILSIKT